MSQTATKANAVVPNATPRTPAVARRGSQVMPAIALGVAIVAAALSVVAIADDVTSKTPPQPVAQQSVPAGAELSPGLGHVNVDDCGRPIVPGRMACR